MKEVRRTPHAQLKKIGFHPSWVPSHHQAMRCREQRPHLPLSKATADPEAAYQTCATLNTVVKARMALLMRSEQVAPYGDAPNCLGTSAAHTTV